MADLPPTLDERLDLLGEREKRLRKLLPLAQSGMSARPRSAAREVAQRALRRFAQAKNVVRIIICLCRGNS